MTVTELRNIVNYLKDNKYKHWRGDKDGFHEIDTIRFPADIELRSKFAAGKSFDLNEKECEYLRDVIPESYSDYVHYRGNFYIIDYGIGKAGHVEKEQIDEKVKIFDFSHDDLDTLAFSVAAAANLLAHALDTYERNSVYDEFNYSIIKEIERPNSAYSKYYSLSAEQEKSVNEWKHIHNKKYHKKGFGYQGASPVSNFEVRFGACSIGDWANCVCLNCLKKAEAETDAKKKDKLRKAASFEIFNNL